MQTREQLTAVIYSTKWIDGRIPEESHWRIIASLNRSGLKNLTIFRFENRATVAIRNQAPLEIISVSDIDFFVDAAIKHCHDHGVFPVTIASNSSTGVSK